MVSLLLVWTSCQTSRQAVGELKRHNKIQNIVRMLIYIIQWVFLSKTEVHGNHWILLSDSVSMITTAYTHAPTDVQIQIQKVYSR